MLNQLTDVLKKLCIIDGSQSGFNGFHLTETRLHRISNNILMQTDKGNSSVLLMLDFISAFDTVEHSTQLDGIKC